LIAFDTRRLLVAVPAGFYTVTDVEGDVSVLIAHLSIDDGVGAGADWWGLGSLGRIVLLLRWLQADAAAI
jgi:hypothetical protein